MRHGFIAITLIFLSACVTTTTEWSAYKTIEYSDSKLAAPSNIRERIKSIKFRNKNSLYQEMIYLDKGAFSFHRYYLGGYSTDMNETKFNRFAQDWKLHKNQKIEANLEMKRNNGVYYSFFNIDQKQCLFGIYFFGNDRALTSGTGKEALISGYYCIPKDGQSDQLLSQFTDGLNSIGLK